LATITCLVVNVAKHLTATKHPSSVLAWALPNASWPPSAWKLWIFDCERLTHNCYNKGAFHLSYFSCFIFICK
jgi:hypothetical protein